jgi:hypothetical protein
MVFYNVCFDTDVFCTPLVTGTDPIITIAVGAGQRNDVLYHDLAS